MVQFIKLTTVDQDTAEHTPSLYQVGKIVGCIQDDDRTMLNVDGDYIVVVESVEQIQAMIYGAPSGKELN